MTDSLQAQIEKLSASLAALEAQRTVLGDVIEPAIAVTRQQLSALEAQLEAEVETKPAEERRLISIFFIDIVGSTSLAEKLDPEEWRQTVAKLHATVGIIITAHHGTVAQYLGDGLLAFFGAQDSSEADAENAIRAALEFPNAVANLGGAQAIQIRVGINTGLVVLGELGADAHKEFTATGDAVNLAARLQSAAPPGGILISHDTYRYVRGVFDVTPQPPLTVKGKTEPIQTYLVRRAKPRAFRTATRGVAGIETRMVGRDAESKQLRDSYLDAFENHGAVWVQLIGEAGVGKSRLLVDTQEWLELRAETFRFLRARSFAGDEKQAYALVRRLWFERFQIAEDAPLAQAEAKWVKGFRELAGTEEIDGNLGTEAAHALGLLVGLPFKASPHIGAMRNDPAQLKGRAFVVSRALLAKMRESNPVVIMLEDLQWTDASSWEWLAQVLLEEKTGANGLFVLATARPEWNLPPILAGTEGAMQSPTHKDTADNNASQYIQITLAPLADGATRELAMELLARVERMPDEIVPLIVERAEGYPYYAEEMVNWFIDRGIIDPNQDPWRFVASRLKESPLPATLQHLLLTRLSGLSDAERAALQRGAIFGRRFWEGGVEALGVRGSAQVLGHLQPRGLVEAQPESSLEGETEWSFSQTLLREVTYESVLKRERPGLHKAAAEWLEEQARRAGRLDEFAGLIGEHFERASEMSTAADWYLQAGEWARTASGLAEARRFFDRALELLPPIDRERRWRALLGRVGVLDLRGERVAQKADVAALLELAEAMDDDARLAEARFRQARYAASVSDYRAALSAADEAIAPAQRAGNSSLAVRALASKIVPHTRLGELKEAQQTVEAALAQAQAADEAALAFVLGRAATHYTESGDLARAVQLHAQAAEMARRLGDRNVEANAMGNLGYAYVQLGFSKLARGTLEQAIALNEALGAPGMRAYNLSNLGLACWRSGDGRTARRLEEQALNELKTIGDPFLWSECQMYIGLIAEQSGDYAGAVRHFTEAREGFKDIGMNAIGTDALAGLARCALAQGRLDEARQSAAEVWDYLCEHGTAGMEFLTRAYQSVSDVFDALEDREQSRAAVEAGYQELMVRADKISDAEWRKSFLENVPEHRAMVEIWERVASGE